jgi:citrate lyase subunit beta / citryl-CoA lyase
MTLTTSNAPCPPTRGNSAFTPTQDALDHARAVVKAFEANPDAGAVELNGRMIDAPHLKQALRLLSFAEASSQV